MADVALRLIDDADLDALFDQMRDPESVQMAAFIVTDPNDREAFDTHMSRLRTSPDIILRWGQGIASQALALFLDTVPVRPLYARAASDNIGSLRVLRKAGFVIIGTETSYAAARKTEIEETILRLG